MSDAELEVSTAFKKRNLKNRGGRKRRHSSSDETKNSSSDEQSVVLPSKRPQKANPNIQSTSGTKKPKPEVDDATSSSDEDKNKKARVTLSVQQQKENATATYEFDTEVDRDAQAIFEKAQKINEELQGQADDKENGTRFLAAVPPRSLPPPASQRPAQPLAPVRLRARLTAENVDSTWFVEMEQRRIAVQARTTAAMERISTALERIVELMESWRPTPN